MLYWKVGRYSEVLRGTHHSKRYKIQIYSDLLQIPSGIPRRGDRYKLSLFWTPIFSWPLEKFMASVILSNCSPRKKLIIIIKFPLLLWKVRKLNPRNAQHDILVRSSRMSKWNTEQTTLGLSKITFSYFIQQRPNFDQSTSCAV